MAQWAMAQTYPLLSEGAVRTRITSLDRFVTVLQQYGCTILPCGLVLPPDLSTEAWEAIGDAADALNQLTKWCKGDWWINGEHRHGARRALFENGRWSGLTYDSCCNAGTVCRAFEIPRRREKLTFSHHAEVASLPRDQQDQLLDWCILKDGKRRSTRELREEVDRLTVVKAAPRMLEPQPPVVTYVTKVSMLERQPIIYELRRLDPAQQQSVTDGTIAAVAARSEEGSAPGHIPMDMEAAFEILEDTIESAAAALDMEKLTQARAALAYLRRNIRSAAA
jgi:hypothetical protein